jgi:hypothetical protein
VPSRWFAFLLFLSSYSPAWLILAIRSFERSCILFWVSVGLAVVSSGAFVLFVWAARQHAAMRVTVTDIEPRDAELAAYVATYLLPFVVVFGAALQDAIALGVFLGIIGLLWVNSSALYLNPLLAVAGYHLYVVILTPTGEAYDPLPRSFLLAKRNDITPGCTIRVDRLAQTALIALPDPK